MASKDPSNIDKHVGYKLKLRRVYSGMRQETLGEKVGLLMHDALLKIFQRVEVLWPVKIIFTSESVSGSPDKVCDLISIVLDAFVTKEPEARVAVETLTTTNKIVFIGEVRPKALLVLKKWSSLVMCA